MLQSPTAPAAGREGDTTAVGPPPSAGEGEEEDLALTMLEAMKDAWRHHKLQVTGFVLLCACSHVAFYMNYVFGE